jgi:hypothetical protein
MATMQESDMFKRRDIETGEAGAGAGGAATASSIAQLRGVTGQRNNNMTDEHRQALMLVRDRDAKIVSTDMFAHCIVFRSMPH